MGGSIVAGMLVRVIPSLCCYVVDHPLWALVMMMILIIENHFASIGVRPSITRSDAQECSRVIINIHR